MAGTIPNLPLSMQFDNITGKPLKGGAKLYFYAANTSTPQDSFQDTGLTLPNAWPIVLDGSGRIPMFYLADGAVRVVLKNSSGVAQFDSPNVLVVGPSVTVIGSPADPTTLFQTGDVVWLDQAGTRTGWVRDNGRTIGSATSGASERANADVSALYTFLWATYPDSACPVNGGRGATAAADFAANKWITLPDKRGRGPHGLDDMGNTAASRLTGTTFTFGDAITAGATGGESAHTLTAGELALHTHGVTDPGHLHQITNLASSNVFAATAITPAYKPGSGNTNTDTATTGISIQSAGGATPPGGGAHNNMSPFVLGTFFRKL